MSRKKTTRTETIQVRLPSGLKAKLSLMAEDQCQDLAAWIRSVLVKEADWVSERMAEREKEKLAASVNDDEPSF